MGLWRHPHTVTHFSLELLRTADIRLCEDETHEHLGVYHDETNHYDGEKTLITSETLKSISSKALTYY